MNIKYLRFILGVVILLSVIFPIRVQAQPSPGGVTGNFKVWLTPDDYNNGTWVNKITGAGSAGNFVRSGVSNNAASSKVTGFNYHPAAHFSKSSNANAFYRLISANTMNVSRGQNVTAIFVYKRANATNYDYLFSFNNSDINSDLVFYTNNSNDLRLYWQSAKRGTVAATKGKGIVAVSIANTSTSATVLGYMDGVSQSITGNWLGVSGISSKWTIGANGSSAAVGYGFEGDIQEIIILDATGSPGNHVDGTTLRKIQSYLAVKYGITLNNSDNYVNSDNTVIWDKAVDGALYNNNIFGIARDDNSSLYQKQSYSANTNLITAYLGSRLATLNSQNTGTIANDKTFLMFGSESGSPIKSLTGVSKNEVYEGGNISTSDDPNIQSPVYRTQLTGETSLTLNMKISMNDYSYVLVSKNPGFPSGVGNGTRLYPIVKYIAQNVAID